MISFLLVTTVCWTGRDRRAASGAIACAVGAWYFQTYCESVNKSDTFWLQAQQALHYTLIGIKHVTVDQTAMPPTV